MRINCKLCTVEFKSLIIDRQLAFKQISEKFLEHLVRKHNREMQELDRKVKVSLQALAEFMSLTKLADIPNAEQWLLDRMLLSQNIVMAALGFEEQKGEDGGSDAVPVGEVEEIEKETDKITRPN